MMSIEVGNEVGRFGQIAWWGGWIRGYGGGWEYGLEVVVWIEEEIWSRYV